MMTTRRNADECDREQQAVVPQWRRGVRSGEDTEPASMRPWLRSHGRYTGTAKTGMYYVLQ